MSTQTGPGYAWLIVKDHLASTPDEDEAGIYGPRDASAEHIALLRQGEGAVFRMYDGDGELYYSGRMVSTEEAAGTEEACYGPLGDFGLPNAGAVEIRYPGHPDWDCG